MSKIGDLWNVDSIIKLWDEEVKKLPLWNVDNIIKLWDKKIDEQRMNQETKQERSERNGAI